MRSPQTTMKIDAVTTRTRIDRSAIALAGVVTGAKMLVGLIKLRHGANVMPRVRDACPHPVGVAGHHCASTVRLPAHSQNWSRLALRERPHARDGVTIAVRDDGDYMQPGTLSLAHSPFVPV